MPTKQCHRCKEERSTDDFYKTDRNNDGLHSWCKPCMTEYSRLNSKKRVSTMKKWAETNPLRNRYHTKKQNARRKGQEFTITLAEIQELWESCGGTCPYFGWQLKFNKGVKANDSVSFDRIDPGKGYVTGNVEILSDLANRMKNSATPEQLVQFAQVVLTRYR